MRIRTRPLSPPAAVLGCLLLSLACAAGAPGLVGCTALTNPDGYQLGPRRDAGDPPADGGSRDAGGRDASNPGVCTADELRCADARLQRCVGGEWDAGEVCERGCSEVEGAHCVTFAPSNVPLEIFVPGHGGIVISRFAIGGEELDTDVCAPVDSIHAEVVTQEDLTELCVIVADDIQVRDDVRVVGSRPLVLLSLGDVSITGVIDLSSEGTVRRGAGGGLGGDLSEPAGGPSPGQPGVHEEPRFDSGGGGGGACGGGGAGGVGEGPGVMVFLPGGPGGEPFEETNLLSPLRGGSGGGVGGGRTTTGGLGGHGGGALQISAAGTISLRDPILLSGGGGGGSQAAMDGVGAGGGGGSGGNILLESPTDILFEGSSAIYANGGGGGAAAQCESLPGEGGEDGRNGVSRASGGRRGDACDGNAFGADGAEAGGAGVIDGDDAPTVGANGGGGGGGAGCIVFRTADGSRPEITRPLSPTSSTAAVRFAPVQYR